MPNKKEIAQNKLAKLDELFKAFQKKIFNIYSRLLLLKRDINKRKEEKKLEEVRKKLKSS